jgi:hypothetical protein
VPSQVDRVIHDLCPHGRPTTSLTVASASHQDVRIRLSTGAFPSQSRSAPSTGYPGSRVVSNSLVIGTPRAQDRTPARAPAPQIVARLEATKLMQGEEHRTIGAEGDDACADSCECLNDPGHEFRVPKRAKSAPFEEQALRHVVGNGSVSSGLMRATRQTVSTG